MSTDKVEEQAQTQSISNLHYLGNKLRPTNMEEANMHKRIRSKQRGRAVVSLEMGQLEEAMRRWPRHKRSESFGGRLDASKIIYDVPMMNASEQITTSDASRVTSAHVGHCDSERTMITRRGEFYLLNKSESEIRRVGEFVAHAQGDETSAIQEQNDSPATKDETTTTKPSHKIDKRLTTKFKLKQLLAKLRSLAFGYLLLASIELIARAEHQHQQRHDGQRALVINVAEARAHDHQHARRHREQHLYGRASNGATNQTSASSILAKEAPQQLREDQHQQQQQQVRTKRATGNGERSAKLLELDALNYLQRYGYMNTSSSSAASSNSPNALLNLMSEDSFHDAIMQFQRFAGIPETGSVDSLTVRYMQMPRCGNKDMSGKGENGKRRRRKRRKRRKRYALQGSKWRRQELTYRISQYPTRFTHKKHEVDQQIERAFRIWSQVAPIDFVVKKEGRVHIDIRFANGEHGDGDPFDGPGNTLAHAYFPQYGGDAHFDDQEYWTVDSYAGTNIFQVAAHELGHSLGLGHSSVREALMAPFYQKYKPNFKLHADDVLAIQALYGERDSDNDTPSSSSSSGTSSTTTTSTTESSVPSPRRKPASPPPPPPVAPKDNDDDEGGFFNFGGPKPVDLCQDARIDTVTRTEDGNTYVFRGQHYWQIKNEGLASGSPGKISRDWDGLPGNLDAALTWSDGKTFFFKGDKYWRFFNKRREPGYPKLISVGFAGIPNNLDAAFVWSGNGKTYFFKRDKYWRFDSKQEPPVSGQYPKPLKNWVGLPGGGVDAAFKWENGMTYFFKDDLYFRFDDREFEVDTSARPAFPRSTAEWWFGCTNSNLPIRRLSGLNADSTNDNEASESSSQLAAASSPPSLLLFHRKPNLSYDTTSAAGSSSSASGRHATSGSSGSSLTRSILSSLSALFPSSSSSSSSSLDNSNNDDQPAADWSFHRGVGEEARRLHFKSARSAPTTTTTSDNNSRWAFPLASGGGSSLSGNAPGETTDGNNNRHHHHHNHHHPNHQPTHRHSISIIGTGTRGEQSMSELRLAPPSEQQAGGNQSASSWLLDNIDGANQTTTGSQDKDKDKDKGQMIRRAGEDKEEEESPVLAVTRSRRGRGERQ